MDVLGTLSAPRVASIMFDTRLSVMSEIDDIAFVAVPESPKVSTDDLEEIRDENGSVRSYILTPVFDSYEEDANIVAFFFLVVPWERYFEKLLPEGKNGFDVVLNDSCGTIVTFSLNGPEASLKGNGDLHDPQFNDLGVGWVYKDSFREMIPILEFDPATTEDNECLYELFVYPTTVLEKSYLTDDPIHYALAVSGIFVFTALVFLAYDWTVARRQDKVLRTATRTQAIVASLFPENVQERILQEAEDQDHQTFTPRFRTNRTKDQLRSFLNDAEEDSPTAASGNMLSLKSRPIADLFPESTVIFAE